MENWNVEELLALVQSTRAMILAGAETLQVTQKGRSDYLTQVDTAVQNYLKNALQERYPQVQFMSEEQDNGAIDLAKPTWVLDPIDGTANLVHGFRHSAVSLALWENGAPVLGVVYQPFTDETWCATHGGGCRYNGAPCHVSDQADLEKCLPMIGTSAYDKTPSKAYFQTIFRIFTACEDIRRSGSAALDLAYVASGRVDCFVEPVLRPWDFGAGLLLVREAGGQVTDYRGAQPTIEKDSSIVASNGKIHQKIMELL
ncbi:MAG: inositol monophosphatase [Oscillospiraceae bacterium]